VKTPKRHPRDGSLEATCVRVQLRVTACDPNGLMQKLPGMGTPGTVGAPAWGRAGEGLRLHEVEELLRPRVGRGVDGAKGSL